MKKVIFFFFLFSLLPHLCKAQSFSIKKTLNWTESPIVHNPTGNHPTQIWKFENALFKDQTPSLPYFEEQFQVNSHGKVEVQLIDAQYESFDKPSSDDDWILGDDLVFNTNIAQNRQEYFAQVQFIPIRKTGPMQFERLISFELSIRFIPTPRVSVRGENTYTSILTEGDVFKIGVAEEGIHKISYTFLKDELGMDIDNIDPAKIHLYGNGGGPLPQPVITDRIDDLEENAIWISGGDDGSFDADDFILFYAEGPHKWIFNEDEVLLDRITNIYDDQNYYFLKVDSDNGRRVGDAGHTIASIASTSNTTTAYTDAIRFEEEKYNLLFESPNSQGSGQQWYSEIFNPVRTRDYDFSVPGLITSQPIQIKTIFAGRGANSSKYKVLAGGQTFTSSNINSVSLANAESVYAHNVGVTASFSVTQPDFSINIDYPAVGDGTNSGWLDYIQLNARRNLELLEQDLTFRDLNSINNNSTTYQIKGASASTAIWDITKPLQGKLINGTNLSGSTLSFGASSEELHSYVAFNTNGSFPVPSKIGEKLENQNYHGIDQIDMVIVYHNDFKEAAEQLAEHRSMHNDLSIALVDVEKLYNEFSSGSKDPTAIRDFAKMLMDRSGQFKYLLLFGDGSYDPRNLNGAGGDFVPVYETRYSLNPVRSFPSDDYFTLLTEDDGETVITGLMDIAVGRFPVRTLEEAYGVVNKIIHYDTSTDVLADWRNRVAFVADDEDSNIHINDIDRISERVAEEHEILNIGKIYFDAFQQIPTSGGARYPTVQETLNREMFRGLLALGYMGHGGGRGWAQERVLTNADIANWKNIDGLPLLVTATCSFSGYDEASYTSAGEQVFLKPDGGAIALFTTTRAVFTSSNEKLTKAVFDTLFEVSNSYRASMGEILRSSKNNSNASAENSRKFTMLGDPSQFLAVPKMNITTTSINGNPVGNGTVDTIRALQTVSITGAVTDLNGNILTDYNGVVSPTVFDKSVPVSTLGQDAGSFVRSFNLQRNIIFKGRASVTNGLFSFTFVVPKDINYEYGNGKISYYAQNGTQLDARGYYKDIVIGGTDPNGIQDNTGPVIEVYMNNEDFVSGGITDANPTLLVKLSDDHGINVVGNSIGHDLTGVLDQNTQNTYILNDFYEAEVDDHTKGTVSFPLFKMAEGLHQITVKAWDVANNPADGFTEFLVTSNEDAALSHVLNYPNPFTTCTNFQFEHNMAGQSLGVQVQIFTVSGKLAKTIDTQVDADGYRVTDIKWDGTDDYGDQLAKGVYIYKIKVNSLSNPTGTSKGESGFEKLVILK